MKTLLLLGKDTLEFRMAESYARFLFRVVSCVGDVGDDMPDEATWWRGDFMVSFLSPWIVPQWLLDRAGGAAINFHPGPPEYPGIGCTNFAIYDGATSYGATCHHMAARVDTGQIIDVRRFGISATDTVQSITTRSRAHLLAMFFGIADALHRGEHLPVSGDSWSRKPYKRCELDALCRVTPHMSRDEVYRRVRACEYPGKPGAYVEMHGVKFYVMEEKS